MGHFISVTLLSTSTILVILPRAFRLRTTEKMQVLNDKHDLNDIAPVSHIRMISSCLKNYSWQWWQHIFKRKLHVSSLEDWLTTYTLIFEWNHSLLEKDSVSWSNEDSYNQSVLIEQSLFSLEIHNHKTLDLHHSSNNRSIMVDIDYYSLSLF